jgi:trehalose 6-phosphate synthase/phosphatase
MNTTSMEFILCQDKTNKSPLVLSEFMGTATSFQSALTINPHDLLGTAEAINKGLTMPQSEREERHAQLFESIQGHTSHTWAATILRQLLENVGGEHTAHQTPALDLGRFKSGYKQAKKRLMLFDYDVSPCVTIGPKAMLTVLAGHAHSHRQGPVPGYPHRPHAKGDPMSRGRPKERCLPHLWSGR